MSSGNGCSTFAHCSAQAPPSTCSRHQRRSSGSKSQAQRDSPSLLKQPRTAAPVKGGSILILCAGTNKKRQQDVARHTPGAVVVENVDLTDFITFAETFSFDDVERRPTSIDCRHVGHDRRGRVIDEDAGQSTQKRNSDQVGVRCRTGRSGLRFKSFSRESNTVLVEINKQAGVRPDIALPPFSRPASGR